MSVPPSKSEARVQKESSAKGGFETHMTIYGLLMACDCLAWGRGIEQLSPYEQNHTETERAHPFWCPSFRRTKNPTNHRRSPEGKHSRETKREKVLFVYLARSTPKNERKWRDFQVSDERFASLAAPLLCSSPRRASHRSTPSTVFIHRPGDQPTLNSLTGGFFP